MRTPYPQLATELNDRKAFCKINTMGFVAATAGNEKFRVSGCLYLLLTRSKVITPRFMENRATYDSSVVFFLEFPSVSAFSKWLASQTLLDLMVPLPTKVFHCGPSLIPSAWSLSVSLTCSLAGYL